MAKSNLAELRKQDADDLRKALNTRRQELMDLRFSHATGALENPGRLGTVKREVAQILTVLNERSRSAVAPTPASES
jgi:large subunit ribosomal protein L29